jgi:hypothetical protein
MLSDALLEKITLFYYFALLDEARSQAAAVYTVKKLLKDGLKDSTDEAEALESFVAVSHKYILDHQAEHKVSSFSLSTGHIVLPERSNWGPWFEFRKVADSREYLAVIYEKVLLIDAAIVSSGLGLPSGTFRHRVSRGLKVLGRICQNSGLEAYNA